MVCCNRVMIAVNISQTPANHARVRLVVHTTIGYLNALMYFINYVSLTQLIAYRKNLSNIVFYKKVQTYSPNIA